MTERDMIKEYAADIREAGGQIPDIDIVDAPAMAISDLQEIWIKLYG